MRDNTTSHQWPSFDRQSSTGTRDICLRDILGINPEQLKRPYSEVQSSSNLLHLPFEGTSKAHYWSQSSDLSLEPSKTSSRRKVLSSEGCSQGYTFGSFKKPRINIEPEDMEKFPEHYNSKFIKEVLNSKHSGHPSVMEPQVRRDYLDKLSVIELNMDKYFKSLRQY